MVPNPPYHPAGDFALARTRRLGRSPRAGGAAASPTATSALYDTALFGELPRGTKLKLSPLFRDWIGRGLVSGERYDGPWANVGTPDDLARLDAVAAGEPRSPAPISTP